MHQLMSRDPQPSEHLDFPCQGCGSNLEFKPGSQHLECPYCGLTQSLEREISKPIVEYSFNEALARHRKGRSDALRTDGRIVACQECGAHTVVTGSASRCAFCQAPVVLVQEEGEQFLPDSVLPFGVEAKRAQEIFRRWIATRWFAPSDLSRHAQRDGVSGIYLPYWTYDSRTTTQYAGLRGDHYYVTESYNDAQGQSRSRRIQKTRWTPSAGVVHVDFDDVLVPATRSLPRDKLDALEPWDLKALEPYAPAFLAGFAAERYAIDLEDGFQRAHDRMEPEVRAKIRSAMGGDVQTITSMQVSYADVTFKHCLLPLWISAFRYKHKVYRFLVNARTGEASGERPYSAVKIALTALVCALLVALFAYWQSNT